MRRCRRRLSLLLLPLLALASLAHAGVALHVDGVEDPLKAAVIDRLELSQYAKREVTAAQAARLYQRVPEQVRATLQPYGYYDASVTGELKETAEGWTAELSVKPGDPVEVAELDLKLDGPAREPKSVRLAFRAFQPRTGQPNNPRP